ncbi:hypothetical protein ACS0TY_004805 [Phlomoides rotata]
MAYAALVSLAQTTDLILNPLKYSVSVDAKHNIMCIHDYAMFVLSFLEYFPGKANCFEARITDAANEAEDVLEYFMWNQIQSRYKWMKRFTVGKSRIKFEYQLEKATGEISSIAGELMDIKKSLGTEDDRLISDSVAAVLTSRNASTGNNDIVMGLDDDLTAIKGRLCGESSKLEVIPILGMGGIGKTTLAKKAYDDALIMEYFDIRVWVTVSQDYSVDETLSRLVDSMKLLVKNKSLMAEKVYKCLKCRRYLIVMDDIWSTKAWDDVRNIFPDDNNGSRIILTTRLSDVAAYPVSDGTPAHEMKFMDENQSWNLLQQKVFTNGQECPPELEDIGKVIARGCRGLPLAVLLVAGILPTIAKTRASWKEIGENVISVVDGEMACFLYIGGFPEDYEISASRLIKLWVDEGFLKCENGCKSLEEKAEEYLKDLVKRSLVLVTRTKTNGEIKSCSLHDLVRELCIRKAQEEKFLHDVTNRYNLQQSIKNKRRISSISLSHFKEIQGPTIHTFLCLRLVGPIISISHSLASIESFRLLRVLIMVCHHAEMLPSQLFELIHLRYLALGTPYYIPATISNLHNLQTLIINSKNKKI